MQASIRQPSDPRGLWRALRFGMRRRSLPHRGLTLGTLLVMVALSLAGTSHAERERGIRLASEGRCGAALEELGAALATTPDDAEVLLLVGTCQARLGRFTDSLTALERARELMPELPGIDLRIAVARYHSGDIAGAAKAMDLAETRGTSGELLLYRGLLALEDQDAESNAAEAARLFDAAARLDPNLEPAAAYYAGLAHRDAGEEAVAQARFRTVIARWPLTSWAVEAERALVVPAERTRLWAEVMGGIEWDDNVILRGEGVALPSEISSERDIRGVWTAAIGGTLFEDIDTVVNARLTYFGRAHRDLDEFDAHYPTVSGWIDQRLVPDTWLRGQVVFGYGWVDGKPFVSNQEAGLSLVRDWAGEAVSSIGADFYRDNYRFSNEDVPDGPPTVGAPCLSPSDLVCGPPGLDESRVRNRDGRGFRLRTDHSIALGPYVPGIDVGYTFHRFTARGGEFSFDGHEVRAGTLLRLPFAFDLALGGFFAYRPYRRSTTFPSTQGLFLNRRYALPERLRRDRTYEATASLSRPLAPRTVFSIRWSYLYNDSSEDVFDYQRHILGAYITIRVGGE